MFYNQELTPILQFSTNLATPPLLAGALDLDALYQEKSGTLGEIYLIDGKSKVLIDTITEADDFESMSAKVRKALASR